MTREEICDVFCQRLAEARQWRDRSQVWTAKAMGVSRQTYIDLEKGRVEPRLYQVYQLAAILDTNPLWLSGMVNDEDDDHGPECICRRNPAMYEAMKCYEYHLTKKWRERDQRTEVL